MIHERVFSGVMFSSAVIYSWFYLTSHDFIKLLSRVVTVSFSFYIACVLCLSLLVSSFFWFLESRKEADSVNLQQAAHPKRRLRVTRVWWSDPCSGVTRMAVCEGQGAMHRLCSPVDRNMVWSGGWQFCQTSLHSDFNSPEDVFKWRIVVFVYVCSCMPCSPCSRLLRYVYLLGYVYNDDSLWIWSSNSTNDLMVLFSFRKWHFNSVIYWMLL